MSKLNVKSLNSKSSSSSTIHSMDVQSPKTSSSMSPKQAERLTSLLQSSAQKLRSNQMEIYYNDHFIKHIDEYVQKWMIELIFDFDHFIKDELSQMVQDKMMEKLDKDVEQYFPKPKSNVDIEQLDHLYRNFGQHLDGKMDRRNQKSNFYEKAIYLYKGIVPENETIKRIYSILEPKLIDAMQRLWRLLTAIFLLVPNVSDSNNSGMIAQKHIKRHVKELKNTVNLFLISNGWLQYGVLRMSHLSHIFRHLQSDDARQAFRSFELAYFQSLRTAVRQLQMEFVILQHLVMQHIELVKQPRIDHSANLAAKIVS